jgi:hypothetical protein
MGRRRRKESAVGSAIGNEDGLCRLNRHRDGAVQRGQIAPRLLQLKGMRQVRGGGASLCGRSSDSPSRGLWKKTSNELRMLLYGNNSGVIAFANRRSTPAASGTKIPNGLRF